MDNEKQFVKDIDEVMDYVSMLLPKMGEYFCKWQDFNARHSLMNSVLATIVFSMTDWANMDKLEKVMFMGLLMDSLDMAANDDPGEDGHTMKKVKFKRSVQ